MSALPSIEALGRYVQQMSDAHHAIDVASSQIDRRKLPPDDYEGAERLCDDREVALRAMILTMPAQTLPDVIVVVAGLMIELHQLDSFERTPDETERTMLVARRALAGILPALIKAAGVDPTGLIDEWSVQQADRTFGVLDRHVVPASSRPGPCESGRS